MKRLTLLLSSTIVAGMLSLPALADAPKVVASIKPVHSLVAAVMEGVGEPGLIVKGAGSPHTYSLKPSDASELDRATVIFWVGETLEPFLEKPVETLGAKARVVELSAAHGLQTWPYREGGPFEAHEDEAHEGDDAGHAAEAGHDDHGEAEKAEAGHHDHEAEEASAEGRDEAHEHEGVDMHIWLDPQNAKAWVHEIEETLSEADPANADRYAANAKGVSEKIDALQNEIAAELEPVKTKPFVVFHDAYQYFEKRFGLNTVGSITVSPEVAPGAQRVTEIRAKVGGLGAACVFAEPQFEPRIVQTVIEGTNAKAGVLDPEGAGLTDGPELYFELLRNLASSLKGCLAEAS